MSKLNNISRSRVALFLFCTCLLSRSEERTNRFGFTGPEIFPIENQISQLKNADLDGDGLQDLIVVNNARSKITLLYNQTGKTNDPTVLKERETHDINDLPPDSRFRIQTISSEKQIGR